MSRPRTSIAAAAVALVLCSAAAWGTDVLLAGKKLVLKQKPRREKLRFVLRDAVPAPALGGPDDPRLAGATLQVLNPTTGESGTFELPASSWRANARGTAYRFRAVTPCRGRRCAPRTTSQATTPVRSAAIVQGKQVKLAANAVGVTLDEATQGGLVVVLTMGSTRYCASFGGTVRKDWPGAFAAKRAPAPTACPPADGTPTTTTTTTTLDPGQTTSTSTPDTSSTSTSSTSTSSTSDSSTSTSTTSTSSTSTSSTTTSTLLPCGGIAPACLGSCPVGMTCTGALAAPCTCQ